MGIALDQRIVDVRVSLPNGRERRGSGFVVAPGRILTALHVLLGEAALRKAAVEPVTETIEVRAIGDLRDGGEFAHIDPARAAIGIAQRSQKSWKRVELIWPAVGSAIPPFELALLEFSDLPPPGAPLSSVVPPLVGHVEDGGVVRAVGFPRWSEIEAPDGKRLLEPQVVHATLKRGPLLHGSTTEANVLGLTLISDAFSDEAEIRRFCQLSGLWNSARVAKRTWPSPLIAPAERDVDLEQFVLAVRASWVEGVLWESLDKDKPLPIRGSFKHSDDTNFRAAVEDQNRPEVDPVTAFLNADRVLLIRGRAGVGKTHALLRIAEFLCWRFEVGRAIFEPAPAILLLKTWRPHSLDLLEWIHGELYRSNRIRRDISERWLAEGRVVLLLDGLDEIDEGERAEALRGINSFLEVFPKLDMVICSRSGEIEEIPQLHGCLDIGTFDPADVQTYVGEISSLAALDGDLKNSSTLLKLARSPLMLRLLMRSYQIGKVDLLAKIPEESSSLKRRMFQLYVQAMLLGAKSTDRYSSEEHFLSRLALLAKLLTNNHQSIFQIERMQPNSLRSSTLIAWSALLSRLVPILIMSLMTGAAAGSGTPLGAALGAFTAWPVSQRLPADVLKSLVIEAITGLVIGITEAVRLTMSRAKIAERRYFAAGYSAVLVAVSTSLCYLVASHAALLRGADSALIFPLAISIFFGTRAAKTVGSNASEDIPLGQFFSFSSKRAAKGLMWGVLIGSLIFLAGYVDRRLLAYCAIYFAVTAMLGLLWAGLRVRRPTRKELQGLGPRLWLANALKSLLVFGGAVTAAVFFLGLTISAFAGSPFGPGTWLSAALTKGVVIGVGAFFVYGGFDFGQHACLRLILKMAGILPIRLHPLLRSAERMNFIIRVGNGYIFAHGELQEYLSGLKSA